MQTKRLEILVIEDTPEFMEVAKLVYDSNPKIAPRYASTYEEAIKILDGGKIQGVISDLFFPSSINWKDRFLPEVKNEIDQRISEMKEKAKTD